MGRRTEFFESFEFLRILSVLYKKRDIITGFLINTRLQSGVWGDRREINRFSGFRAFPKAVKTALRPFSCITTWLKPGVNETSEEFCHAPFLMWQFAPLETIKRLFELE